MNEVIHSLMTSYILNYRSEIQCIPVVHYLSLCTFMQGGVVWRVQCSDRKLVCAVGSRNGIEDTKLLVLDFDA